MTVATSATAADDRVANPLQPLVPEMRITARGEIVYREPTISVKRSIRDDPLGRLHARRQIGKAQYEAGRRWQAAYEAAGIGHIGSIDPSNEPVDGSKRFATPDLDRITKAAALLARWDRILGQEGCAIVRDVLANRRDMDEVAKSRGENSQRAIDYFARRLRECLSTLAREMGLA